MTRDYLWLQGREIPWGQLPSKSRGYHYRPARRAHLLGAIAPLTNRLDAAGRRMGGTFGYEGFVESQCVFQRMAVKIIGRYIDGGTPSRRSLNGRVRLCKTANYLRVRFEGTIGANQATAPFMFEGVIRRAIENGRVEIRVIAEQCAHSARCNQFR